MKCSSDALPDAAARRPYLPKFRARLVGRDGALRRPMPSRTHAGQTPNKPQTNPERILNEPRLGCSSDAPPDAAARRPYLRVERRSLDRLHQGRCSRTVASRRSSHPFFVPKTFRPFHLPTPMEPVKSPSRPYLHRDYRINSLALYGSPQRPVGAPGLQRDALSGNPGRASVPQFASLDHR